MNYRERKAFLKKQLVDYEKNMPMTKAERRELREWVACGNSPYTNMYTIVKWDEFWEMDFISALRTMKEREKQLILEEELEPGLPEDIAEDLPF